MRIVLYGGSFDPVHSEHVACARAAKEALSADRIIVIPAALAPHKSFGARASGKDRIAMLEAAFNGIAEVSDCEIAQAGTSYTYLTCERFKNPNDTLFLLMGADMLEDFDTWKHPERILACATLAVCGRENALPADAHARFQAKYGVDFAEIPYVGKAVSSTELRVKLAFQMKPEEMPPAAYGIALQNNLYTHPAIPPALALEKEERRAHSFRVALMACGRARALHISEERALLAAALHDCGKYVPLSSPMLAGFAPPEDVPAPVLHQYTGAYLAEHQFKIDDEDVLNAIRYHTSGRVGMSELEMLIYLSDLLESGRMFDGVDFLRGIFFRDLKQCMREALKMQIEYLSMSRKKIYPLTEAAYAWLQGMKY